MENGSIRCERCGKEAKFLNTTGHSSGNAEYHYRCNDCLWQGSVVKPWGSPA